MRMKIIVLTMVMMMMMMMTVVVMMMMMTVVVTMLMMIMIIMKMMIIVMMIIMMMVMKAQIKLDRTCIFYLFLHSHRKHLLPSSSPSSASNTICHAYLSIPDSFQTKRQIKSVILVPYLTYG